SNVSKKMARPTTATTTSTTRPINMRLNHVFIAAPRVPRLKKNEHNRAPSGKVWERFVPPGRRLRGDAWQYGNKPTPPARPDTDNCSPHGHPSRFPPPKAAYIAASHAEGRTARAHRGHAGARTDFCAGAPQWRHASVRRCPGPAGSVRLYRPAELPGHLLRGRQRPAPGAGFLRHGHGVLPARRRRPHRARRTVLRPPDPHR